MPATCQQRQINTFGRSARHNWRYSDEGHWMDFSTFNNQLSEPFAFARRKRRLGTSICYCVHASCCMVHSSYSPLIMGTPSYFMTAFYLFILSEDGWSSTQLTALHIPLTAENTSFRTHAHTCAHTHARTHAPTTNAHTHTHTGTHTHA